MQNTAIFAKRFKMLRKNADKTQEEMSVIFDVVQQTIQKWESGENLPQKNKLIEIANYFKVTVDWLLGYSDKEAPVASLDQADKELLEKFWKLNDFGKQRLNETLDDLLQLQKYTEKRRISAS